MKILGVDLDTFDLTCVLIDSEKLKILKTFQAQEKRQGRAEERFYYTTPKLKKFFQRNHQRIEIVIVEHPVIGLNAAGSMALMSLEGVVKFFCLEYNIPYKTKYPSQWRKVLAATKETTPAIVMKIIPKCPKDETKHWYDAVAIALSEVGVK